MSFVKEVLRGKNLNRAALFSVLEKVFHDEKWLSGAYSVLEIGEEKASHERTYPIGWKRVNSNYKKIDGVDIIIDANERFPIENEKFDGVTMFNVLYLVDDYLNCLKESLRVSKKFVIFNIPLISNIARHPVDMNRFTEDRLISLISILKSSGVKDWRIVPIGGSFSSAVVLVDVYLRFRIIRLPIYLLARMLDKIDLRFGYSCPTQYLVILKK